MSLNVQAESLWSENEIQIAQAKSPQMESEQSAVIPEDTDTQSIMLNHLPPLNMDNAVPSTIKADTSSNERRVIPGMPPPIQAYASKTQAETDAKKAQKQSKKTKQSVQLQNANRQNQATGNTKRAADEPTLKTKRAEKPMVHFPELPVQPTIITSSNKENHKEKVTIRLERKSYQYPWGYKSATAPHNAQQRDWHQQAINAYQLGNLMERQGRLDQAIGSYQKALQLAPYFADAYIGLSTAYILQGNWEAVLENAQHGLSLKKGFIDPSNIVRARYNLSAAYCAVDNYGKAVHYYKLIQKANYPLAIQLQTYLQNCKH